MKMKNWMRNAGFTLVELIVVIAVLGVLGAGAAVGYSGYTKKAAKAADEQLAAQIKYALEVAQVSDPMPNGAAALVLSKTGAKVTPEADADGVVAPAAQWVSNAMANAFGDNWTNELKLQYGEWGKGSAISAKTLGYFGNVSVEGNDKYDKGIASVVEGKAVPSFANDVDDLFVMIRDTAIAVNGLGYGGSGAELVQGAAKYTTTATGATTAEGFANMWKKFGWLNMVDGEVTTEKASSIANSGVVKARNVALACYLRKNGVDEAFCKEVENCTALEVDKNGNKVTVPLDAATMHYYGAQETLEFMPQELKEMYTKPQADGKIALDGMYTQPQQALAAAAEKAGDAMTSDGTGRTLSGIIDAYFESDGSTPSQAYLDGLAYYTMMSTVNNVNNEGHSANDDTYWDEMAGAVGLYGSIARGEATLEDLKAALGNAAEGDVSVAVMAGQKGLVVKFSPLTIAP